MNTNSHSSGYPYSCYSSRLRRSVLTLLLAASSLCSLKALAQDKKLTGGIKGGLNLSNFYTSEIDDKNAKVAFHAGLFLKAPIAGPLSVQPELLYSLQGSQVTYKPFLLSSGGKIRYNLSYLNLPLLAVVNANQHFNFQAGPYGAILLSSKIKDVDENGNTNYVTELDRDDFTTLDYGVTGGLGIDFKGGTLGLRYNYGLRQVGKPGTKLGEALQNSKNSVFQLSLGFTL